MAFQLSRKDQRGKTELLSYVREKHLVVCAQIDACNAVMEAARNQIRAALQEYGSGVEQLQAFASRIEAVGTRAFEAQSEGWQTSSEGIAVREWIACYRSYKPEVCRLALPPEIETLDDGLLSDFEELPDAP